jgi:Ras-related protein Rab-23
VEKWKAKVDQECGDITMVLMQNKMDLIDDAVVESKEVDRLAERLGMKVYRTCVKDNTNVTAIFDYLAEKYLEKRSKQQDDSVAASIGSGGARKKGGKNEDKGIVKATYEAPAAKKKKKRCIIL